MDAETHEIMSQALIERGLATPDQVAADRASLEAELNGTGGGFDPLADESKQRPAVSGAVPGSDEDTGAGIDAHAFAGPASPDHYVFERPFGAPASTPEQLAMEQTMREALHAEAVPVAIAREVDKLLARGLASPPTPAQLEQGRQAGAATLAKVWGADRDKNLAIANNELRRLTARMPGLPGMLAESGVGNSAWLAQTLYLQAKARGRG